MKNKKEFIEAVYKTKGNDDVIRNIKGTSFEPIDWCHDKVRVVIYDLLFQSGNDNLPDEEVSICLAVAMLIVNTNFAKSNVPFEERCGVFSREDENNQNRVKYILSRLDFRHPNLLKQFYYIAKDVIAQKGGCDMTKLLSDMLDWEEKKELHHQWIREICQGGLEYGKI